MEVELNVRNPKLKRTLERFKAKIAEGDFYEAHQTLRTIANRNVRSKAFGDAIDLLYHAAQILLKTSQPATGSDLTSYLVEVYNESDTRVDNESKSKLIQLISLFDPLEPTLKQVGIESINWSVKHGDNPFGDADLHHALGQKFVEAPALAYEAEKHLILGTPHSTELYIKHIWSWYLEDPEPTHIGSFVSRIVLNYLFIQNVKAANESLASLISKFCDEYPKFTHETVSESGISIELFESVPLLNFIQLLLKTVSTGNAQLYNKLLSRYSTVIQQADLKEATAFIGELYFGVAVPKQVNLLQNLMSGFMGK